MSGGCQRLRYITCPAPWLSRVHQSIGCSLIHQQWHFHSLDLQVKAWCYYESRLLGAHHGLISTYALETMVLYIFNVFHKELKTACQASPFAVSSICFCTTVVCVSVCCGRFSCDSSIACPENNLLWPPGRQGHVLQQMSDARPCRHSCWPARRAAQSIAVLCGGARRAGAVC